MRRTLYIVLLAAFVQLTMPPFAAYSQKEYQNFWRFNRDHWLSFAENTYRKEPMLKRAIEDGPDYNDWYGLWYSFNGGSWSGLCVSDPASGKPHTVVYPWSHRNQYDSLLRGSSWSWQAYNDGNDSSVTKNGSRLQGTGIGVHHSLFIRRPGFPRQMLLFSSVGYNLDNPELADAYKGLYMHILDLDGDNGLGEMIAKNIHVSSVPLAGALAAARDCNGDGWWIIGRHFYEPTFYSFHVDGSGNVEANPSIARYAPKSPTVWFYGTSFMFASPNGKTLALVNNGAHRYPNLSSVSLFDLDLSTGLPSNERVIDRRRLYHSGSFSPDNAKMYLTDWTAFNQGVPLVQYEVDGVHEDTIRNSRAYVGSPNLFVLSLWTSPDRRLNFTQDPTPGQGMDIVVSRLMEPNAKGDLSQPMNLFPTPYTRYLGHNLINSFANEFRGFSGRDTTVRTCRGSAVSIGLPPVPGVVYRWSPRLGLSHPDSSRTWAVVDSETEYSLEAVRPWESCASLRTFRKKVLIEAVDDRPRVSVGFRERTICPGSSVELRSAGGKRFLWSPSEGLSDASSPNPVCRPTRSTTYRVYVWNDYCMDSSLVSVNLSVNRAGSVGRDTVLCPGTGVRLGSAGSVGLSFVWSPSDGLDNALSPSPFALPSRTTRYYRQTTDADGCVFVDSVLVSVGESLSVSEESFSMCLGSSVQLFASGAEEYEWIPSTGLSDSRIANPVASPSLSTTYRVVGRRGLCLDSSLVLVLVRPNPLGLPFSQAGLCHGEPARIGGVSEPGVSYRWFPSSDLDDSLSSSPLCSSPEPRLYVRRSTTEHGCIRFDSVRVFPTEGLVLESTPNSSMCSGSSVQLLASGADEYEWIPSTGLSDSRIANPIASPSSTTTYIVTGKRGSCVGSSSTTIAVLPAPSLRSIEAATACLGSSVQLWASGADEYEWNPSTGLDNAFVANPVASPLDTILYRVVGRRGLCSDTVYVRVTAVAPPSLRTSVSAVVCSGSSVQLFASGAEEYEWIPSTGLSDSRIANPVASPVSTTEYRVTGSSGGCSSSGSVLVEVLSPPSLSVSSDTTICSEGWISLSASGASSYQWEPSSLLNDSRLANPRAFVSENTVFSVRGCDSLGCCSDAAVVATVVPRSSIRLYPIVEQESLAVPGESLDLSIVVPAEVESAWLSLVYDSCCVVCGPEAFPSSSVSEVVALSDRVRLHLVNGSGSALNLRIPCMFYLPPDGRLLEEFAVAEIDWEGGCLDVSGGSGSVEYDASCAWSLRGVKASAGFGLSSDGSKAFVETGYGGRARLGLYSVAGVEVWRFEQDCGSSERLSVSLPDLSRGLYILKAGVGSWTSAVKVFK